MFQQTIIIGYLGRDPEMRYTPAGQPVTTFSVATSRQYTNNDGQPVKETTWFRVTAWGKTGEACNNYLQKGSKVMVEGRLTPDSSTGGPRIYKRNDETMGANYEITASTVRFLSDRQDENTEKEKYEPIAGQPEDEIPF
jgi:single-strand DNA-binding protein